MIRLKQTLPFLITLFLLSACKLGGTTLSTSSQAGPTKSATLSWAAGTGIITGYTIEQSTDNINFTQAAQVGNVTTATVTGLVVNSTYYFRVRSTNPGGASPPSAVTSLTIAAQ